MSTRYFLAQILGNGDGDVEPTTTAGPYRAATVDHAGVTSQAVIPSDPVTGLPRFTWALAVADGDLAALLRDPMLFALPAVELSAATIDIDAAELAALQMALVQRGAPESIVTSAATFRDIVIGIGRHLDTSFNPVVFGLA